MEEYDKKFNLECARILKEVYSANPHKGIKAAVVQTELKYAEYLEKLELVQCMKSVSGANGVALQLKQKGHEVFEKYNGWQDFKSKVIDHQSNIEKAKELNIIYWWLPIAISVLAFIVSVIALFLKK